MKDGSLKNSEGIGFFNSGKYEEAIQSFSQAINAYPQDKIGDSLYYDINLNLANSYQMDGEYDNAKDLYEQLLKNDPGRSSRYKVEFDNLMLELKITNLWKDCLWNHAKITPQLKCLEIKGYVLWLRRFYLIFQELNLL